MTGFSRRALLTLGLVLLAAAGSLSAQDGIVSIDKVSGLFNGTSIAAGQDVRINMRFNNTMGIKTDVSNGWKISSPDGAVWDSVTIDSLGPYDSDMWWFSRYFNIALGTYSGPLYGANGSPSPDTVGILASGTPSLSFRQLPPTYNDTGLAVTIWFNGQASANAGKHICVDSSFFGVGGTWVWTIPDQDGDFSPESRYPAWTGLPGHVYSDGTGPDRIGSGYCFDLYAPALEVTTDSLYFNTVQGGTTPPPQSFTVNSTGDGLGDHLSFTLVESSSWLLKTPSSGTTPRAISVSVNITGVTAGVYIDSIQVESAGAYNSPQWVKVVLEITPPAPTIFVSKPSFVFAAITGGANPADQSFYIKNTGGSSLNWALSKSSSWLGLNPASGVDSNTVVVSADITGLGYGDHFDTIVVADVAATNSPVKIPVRLSLGSSLPLIQSDSTVFHVIVDETITPPPRVVTITNGGIGTLTFTASENSNRLLTVTPISGTAPQAITVTFKVACSFEGQELFDTLWISSPEAVNSPYPVVFHFACLSDPALLSVSRDTIELITYSCSQFDTAPSSSLIRLVDTFLVADTSQYSGYPPRMAKLSYQSDLFVVSPLEYVELPSPVFVEAQHPELPPGVYYDTIIVSVQFGYNTPQMVIVKYTRFEYGPNPELFLSKEGIDIPRQEQTGPVAFSLEVLNSGFGCLPWHIEEDVPWFTPVTDTGNVPGEMRGIINTDDLTLGTYKDSFYVHAPLAPNSPQVIRLKVRMWRLHGDCNWNGFIDGTDLAWLVSYFIYGQPVPWPEYAVGDLDCSGLIDLSDLARMVAYVTYPGVTICGNP